MQDPNELAEEIARDVQKRRNAGEHISDEEVLDANPHVRDELRSLLKRLQFIDMAKGEVAPKPDSHAQSPFHRSNHTDLQITQVEEIEEDAVGGTELSIAQTNEAVAPDLGPERFASKAIRYRPQIRASMGIVKLYHDNMQSFNPYPVMSDVFQIGRASGDLVVPHDFRMSKLHAEIRRIGDAGKYKWSLVDMGSTNGTFVRINQVQLSDGDELILGLERYRFVQDSSVVGLCHSEGEMWKFNSNSVTIGRNPGCELESCQNDPFLDNTHAFIKRGEGGKWKLIDTDSLNHVWYRITNIPLPKSCNFLLGEQRFGFVRW